MASAVERALEPNPILGHPCGLIAVLSLSLISGSAVAATAPPNATGHWAFQPVRPGTPPAVRNQAWPRNPIDRFILAKLEAERLQPARPATREEYIRRVTFGLIGLPPTPGEIDAHLSDESVNAEETLVDRLLASPHYGERWGRHWLDLARFGETDGFEHDAVRPNAWRFRDYVVRSFNADKPYDRFIREQIAGDLLFPNDPDAAIATGFNLLGPDMVDSSDQVQRRHNTLNDMTDTTGLVFLGMTLGCARCHDHKLEPVTQTDYYRLQAFFTPAVFERKLDVATKQERARRDRALERFEAAKRPIQEAIRALERPYRRELRVAKLKQLDPETRAAHEKPGNKRTPEEQKWVKQTEGQLEIKEDELAKAMSREDRAERDRLMDQLKVLHEPAPLPHAMALRQGKPEKTFILHRGEYSMPKDQVSPGFPEAIADFQTPSRKRSDLADWIASPEHPLTARVMVNRIWQHHFGRGIVATPSDFGLQGAAPTHPELLDWLATEFVRSGWSIKAMHKLILLSATYRQSSRAGAQALERDPDNRLFSRRNRVRLEGEIIRDSLLAIGGRLNTAMGGPGVFPPIPADLFKGARGWSVSKEPDDHHRRSLYIFVRRNLRYPFLEVFDAPDSNLSCAARGRSTSAPQSLTLLNSELVLAAAKSAAERVLRENASTDAQITRLYRLVLGRPPSESERAASIEFLEQSPFHELCRALFNLNAFVYVD